MRHTVSVPETWNGFVPANDPISTGSLNALYEQPWHDQRNSLNPTAPTDYTHTPEAWFDEPETDETAVEAVKPVSPAVATYATDVWLQIRGVHQRMRAGTGDMYYSEMISRGHHADPEVQALIAEQDYADREAERAERAHAWLASFQATLSQETVSEPTSIELKFVEPDPVQEWPAVPNQTEQTVPYIPGPDGAQYPAADAEVHVLTPEESAFLDAAEREAHRAAADLVTEQRMQEPAPRHYAGRHEHKEATEQRERAGKRWRRAITSLGSTAIVGGMTMIVHGMGHLDSVMHLIRR
jgi:hypothetical protein